MGTSRHKLLIEKWLEDTSRAMEYRYVDETGNYWCNWLPCDKNNIVWRENYEYRFRDEQIDDCVASISDGELRGILIREEYDLPNPVLEFATLKLLRLFANVGAVRERHTIRSMPAKTNLTAEELLDLYEEEESELITSKALQNFANAVIGHFLKGFK